VSVVGFVAVFAVCFINIIITIIIIIILILIIIMGLSRTASALKPLASGRIGQGAKPAPPKTIHVNAYNSRKISCLCVHPHDGILFLFLPNFTTNLTKHTHRQANDLSIL